MRLNVCVNEMAPFGPFAAIVKGCITLTVVVEMDASPQDEMANPQGMKMFAFERHGLPKDFVCFRTLCGVQSSPLVFAPNRAFVYGLLQGQAPGETVFQICVILSLALKLVNNTLISLVPMPKWTLLLRVPDETVECVSRMVEDGGRER